MHTLVSVLYLLLFKQTSCSPVKCSEPLGRKEGFGFYFAWTHANMQHCSTVQRLFRDNRITVRHRAVFPHLTIQKGHRNVAIDMAPPGAQSGELHRGGSWKGRWHRRRLGGQLELIAAAEMPHLGCCSSMTPSQWQGHLVVVRNLCCQGNLRVKKAQPFSCFPMRQVNRMISLNSFTGDLVCSLRSSSLERVKGTTPSHSGNCPVEKCFITSHSGVSLIGWHAASSCKSFDNSSVWCVECTKRSKRATALPDSIHPLHPPLSLHVYLMLISVNAA